MKILANIMKRRSVLLAIALAVAIGGASTVAVLAAIPDSQGTIHGCRLNDTGAVRIIDSATESCTEFETTVDWQQASDTKVYTNRVDYNSQVQGLQTVLSLPEFGEFTVDPANCTPEAFWGSQVHYENTGAMEILPIVTGAVPNGVDLVPSDGEADISFESNSNTVTVTLYGGTGIGAKSATIHFGGWMQINNSTCIYAITATVTQ